MKNNISRPPIPTCEPVKSYGPGTTEREEAQIEYQNTISKTINIPMWINGKNITTKKIQKISPPHDHKNIVGQYYEGNETHVHSAIEAALKAKKKWEETSWEDRSSIFLKAAELLAGPYRQKMNIATMIGQSKNIFQAENLPIKNVGLAERGGNLVQVVRRLEVDLPHHQQNPPPQIQRDLL